MMELNLKPYHNLRYIGILTLGILITLIAVLANSTDIKALEAPKQELWRVYSLWGGVALVGYAASFASDILHYIKKFSLEYLPDLLLMVGIASWGYNVWWMENAEIAYLVLCLGLLLWRRQLHFRQISTVHWACIIYAITTALGVLWSGYPKLGMKFVEKQLMLVLLPLSAGIVSLSKAQVLRVSWIVLRICLSFLVLQTMLYLYLVTAYSDGILDGFTINKFYLRDFPETTVYNILMTWTNMEHPSYHLLFFSAPWATILGLSSRLRKGLRLELGLYYLFLAIFTIITQARYGFWVLGLLPLLALVGYARPSHYTRKQILIAGSAVATILVATLCYLHQRGIFEDGPRLEMFAYAMELIKRHGILGAGTGTDYTLFMERFGQPHSHNTFLSVAIDTGLLGVTAMLALVGSTVYAAARYGNRAVLYWMLLLLPMMLIDSPFYVPRIVYPMALYFLILGGNHLAHGDRKQEAHSTVSPPIQ
ncbi:MAG: hypothetical protein Q4A64_08790 [Porphyromonadaceae bacterium]|nr:hypothetical protein [Porphyromonadaceae bacterium]